MISPRIYRGHSRRDGDDLILLAYGTPDRVVGVATWADAALGNMSNYVQDTRTMSLNGALSHEPTPSHRHSGCGECGWAFSVHGVPTHFECDRCLALVSVDDKPFIGAYSMEQSDPRTVLSEDGREFVYPSREQAVTRLFCSDDCRVLWLRNE